MAGFGLAYVALVATEVSAATAALRLLGLRQEAVRVDAAGRTVPVFPLGASALAVFAPTDPFLAGDARGGDARGGDAKPGVHHIALAAADPPAAAAMLAARGFAAGPPLPALGGGPRLALDPAMTAGVRTVLSPPLGLGAGGSDHALRIDHVGIASADNRAAIAAFHNGIGCPVESQQTDLEVQSAMESFTSDRYGVVHHARPPVVVGGLRVAFLTAGDCELEFLQNLDPRQEGSLRQGTPGDTRQDQGAIARFVARHGPGLHHVAFRCPDIDRTLAMLAAGGLAVIDRTGRPGSRRARIGFVHPKGLGGILIHAVERADSTC